MKRSIYTICLLLSLSASHVIADTIKAEITNNTKTTFSNLFVKSSYQAQACQGVSLNIDKLEPGIHYKMVIANIPAECNKEFLTFVAIDTSSKDRATCGSLENNWIYSINGPDYYLNYWCTVTTFES